MAGIDLDEVRSVADTVLSERGLALVDVEVEGSGRARIVRVLVERAERGQEEAVDLDTLAGVSAPIAHALDDVDAVASAYTLEVSSPGLERPLRRPADFRRFVGTTVTVKTHEAQSGARRHRGMLVDAGDEGMTVDVDGDRRSFRYDGIASARTVFEWGQRGVR